MYKGWSSSEKGSKLIETQFELPPLGPEDVGIQVEACGICHSDLHLIDGDWGPMPRPMIAGHEVVGKIVAIGKNVPSHRMGQRVGLGWQAGSCGKCVSCSEHEEHLCPTSQPTAIGRPGGFANLVRSHHHFAIEVPANISSAEAAPLFCGGITVFSPLDRYVKGRGKEVAIIGIGGLGHLAIQFAAKMGHKVTAISTTEAKKEEALSLGATSFVNSKDAIQTKQLAGRFDFVLSTIFADANWSEVMSWLRPHGNLCFVGVPSKPIQLGGMDLLNGEKFVSGSMIGSPDHIHRMIHFAAEHNVRAKIEKMPITQINTALDRLRKNDVRYRFVMEV